MLETKQLWGAFDFHGISFRWLPSTVWFTNILQNILFCVQQNKETHIDMEKYEGEKIMNDLKFLGNL